MNKRARILGAGVGLLILFGFASAFFLGKNLDVSDNVKVTAGVRRDLPGAAPVLYDAAKITSMCQVINDGYADRGIRGGEDLMLRMIRGGALGVPEVRAVLRSFLEHPDIRMQFYAALYLFETGSAEGRGALIRILNSNSVVPDGPDDLRIRAARCLANFRDYESLADLLACKIDGRENPFLKAIFLRFGDAVGPQNALLAKAQILGLDVLGLDGKTISIDAGKLREHAQNMFNSDVSLKLSRVRDASDAQGVVMDDNYNKDLAAWVLLLDGNSPEALARLVESGKKEINREEPRYDGRDQVLKMLGTIDSPEARAVLVSGLSNRSTAEICAANLLFCQSDGSEPVRQMVLDELRPGKEPEKRVLSYEMKWTLVAVFKDDSAVRSAAMAADARAGLGDWEYYVEQRGDWPVYNWSSNSVYWYKRTKLESGSITGSGR